MLKIILITLLLSICNYSSAQSVSFREGGIDFEVTSGNYSIKYQTSNNERISYNTDGKVAQIGNITISYNVSGFVSRVGSVYISYNSRNQLFNIGGKTLSYDYDGRYTGSTGEVNNSNQVSSNITSPQINVDLYKPLSMDADISKKIAQGQSEEKIRISTEIEGRYYKAKSYPAVISNGWHEVVIVKTASSGYKSSSYNIEVWVVNNEICFFYDKNMHYGHPTQPVGKIHAGKGTCKIYSFYDDTWKSPDMNYINTEDVTAYFFKEIDTPNSGKQVLEDFVKFGLGNVVFWTDKGRKTGRITILISDKFDDTYYNFGGFDPKNYSKQPTENCKDLTQNEYTLLARYKSGIYKIIAISENGHSWRGTVEFTKDGCQKMLLSPNK